MGVARRSTPAASLYRCDEVTQDTAIHTDAARHLGYCLNIRISSLTDQYLGICLERIEIEDGTGCYDRRSGIHIYAASKGISAGGLRNAHQDIYQGLSRQDLAVDFLEQ
jgi:hypothetical protein